MSLPSVPGGKAEILAEIHGDEPGGYEIVEAGPDAGERLREALEATQTGVVVLVERSGLSDLSRLEAFVVALRAGAAVEKPATSTEAPD